MISRYPIDAGQLALRGNRAIPSDRTRCVALPSTEAAADASTFVAEFLGGAGANETGVGLGLTGADLVLTQAGNVAASSGGYRALDATDDAFTCTVPMLNAFLKGAEWTLAYKLKLATQVTTGQFLYLGQAGQTYMLVRQDANNHFVLVFATPTTVVSYYTLSTAKSITAVFWLCVWRKNGILHFGFVEQEAIPTGWDSFPSTNRIAIPGFGDFSASTLDAAAIVGGAGSSGFSISTLVCSTLGLASAPV